MWLTQLQEILATGGAFTLSDDSHGIGQVGTNYGKLLDFVEKTDLPTLTYFEKNTTTKDDRFPGVSTKMITVTSIKEHPTFF